MPSDKSGQKAGNLKDPAIAALFFTEDPDKLFDDLREIGHGSFGAVYYARNVNTNEAVAVKKMSYGGKQSLEKWQDIIKEVRFLTQIQHPNIVDYKGCYLKEHTAWLAMEYCIGSASDLVEVHKTSLEEAEISGIIHEAMQGLHYLHVHNKIHRDVKAGNILLTDQGHVKLADFGSASIASPANSFVGTPYWMAPEVILAMDEGQYDGKADIWSMGITSVELAERKPPLFNMNAMSALYHIAQNDPPVLNDPEDEESRPRRSWSQDFRNFVALLLQKVPDDRPTSNEVLQHPFMTKPRSATVVLELIERTKNVVRDLDNLQYRKMKKILIAETRQRQSNQTAAGATANSEGQMDEDRESLDGGSSRTNSLVSLQSNPSLVSIPGSSKSNSMNSLNDSHLSDTSSVNSQEGASSGISEQDVSTSHPSSLLTTSYSNHPTGSLQSLRPLATLRGGDKSDSSSTSSVTSLHQHQPPDQGATSGKGPTRGSRNQKDRPPPGPVYHLQDTMSPETIQKRTQAVQLESSGFATIRSAQVIHRQLYEHNEDNRHREQLLGYKRMRQQHQKQLINYEQKLKNEMDEYSIKLIKELENLRSQYSQELERLIKRHQQDLEKEAKAVMSDDKKFQKHIGQQQDHEIKGFLLQQKKDYKSKKEQLKEDTNNLKASKDMKTDWLNRQISTLTSMHSRAESELRERHQQNLDLELRKYRRRALLARHNREQDLLREELNMKQKHKEKEHEVLLTQHDSTQLLEYKHLYAIQEQRMEHLKSQHQTELSNQVEYSQRRENELKRKHLAAMRQQPKSLKVSSGGLDTTQRNMVEQTEMDKDGVYGCCMVDGVWYGVVGMVCGLDVSECWLLFNVVENLILVMEEMDHLGFYDDLVGMEDEVDLGFCEDVCSSGDASDSSSLVDVTEDDLIQLAAETEQDDGEKEDLIEGLRTLRFGSQEQVVISLRSKFIEDKDIPDDDDEEDGVKDEDTNDDLVLPPEKSRTCPASSFAEVLKPPQVSQRKSSDGDLEKLPKMKSDAQSVPKKCKSLPDIAEKGKKSPTKVKKARKSFATSEATTRQSKPVWNRGKFVPVVKPAKFFGNSLSPKSGNQIESPKKGLRERVLTRAAEWNKKTDENKQVIRSPQKPRGISKSIQEKSKMFSDEIKYGIVYTRPSSNVNGVEKKPWGYGAGKTPPTPLKTLKSFVMRKAPPKKHELGLDRNQLKNLQSGLSKVFNHSHKSSCSPLSSSLSSSPLGRVSSVSSRLTSATFSSSNEPQAEYQGCEVCRLKEAMRNSPVSHRLKSTPHRCSSQTQLIDPETRSSNKTSSKLELKQKKSSSPPKSSSKKIKSSEKLPEKEKSSVFSSPILPCIVFGIVAFILIISLYSLVYCSWKVVFITFSLIALLLRFTQHCFTFQTPKNKTFDVLTKYKILPILQIPPNIQRDITSIWSSLSSIPWQDGIKSAIQYLPTTSPAWVYISQQFTEDFKSLLHLIKQRLSFLTSIMGYIMHNIPPAQQQYFIMAAFVTLLLLLYIFPAQFLFTLLILAVTSPVVDLVRSKVGF
ncbi:uncharacterized protein LOC100185876 isoform X2 [Ciona intestinalis]